MPHQSSFADLDYDHKKRRPRREVFLSEMEGVILINAHLKAQGLLVSKGTMVEATPIHASSSTKNREQARPGDVPDQEGKVMVLWHEGTCWCRCGLRGGAHG